MTLRIIISFSVSGVEGVLQAFLYRIIISVSVSGVAGVLQAFLYTLNGLPCSVYFSNRLSNVYMSTFNTLI